MTQNHLEPIDVKASPDHPAQLPPSSYIQAAISKIRSSVFYVGDGGFIAQAMGAQSLEEATETGETWSGQAHTGQRFRFLDARFADSDLDGRMPFFALCNVVDDKSGEKGLLTVGGGRVVATLFRAAEMGWFPFDAYLEPIALGGSKEALNLVLAPTRVANTKK